MKNYNKFPSEPCTLNSKGTVEPEVTIQSLLNKKDFKWIEGLNYRDYILAVWRTLLKDNFTKPEAETILNLISEEEILGIISNNLKPNF